MTNTTIEKITANKDCIITLESLSDQSDNRVLGIIKIDRKGYPKPAVANFFAYFNNEKEVIAFLIKNESKEFGKYEDKCFEIKISPSKNVLHICLNNAQDFL